MFPFDLSLTVDAELRGPVVVTVEGLDWDTNAVIASGTAPGDRRRAEDDARRR